MTSKTKLAIEETYWLWFEVLLLGWLLEVGVNGWTGLSHLLSLLAAGVETIPGFALVSGPTLVGNLDGS